MAVTGGLTCKYRPGSIVTMKVSAAVTQGAPLQVSGDGTVATAPTGSTKIVGIALQTASAANDLIAVQVNGYVFVLTAKGAITAGDPVGAASDGSAAVSTIAVAAFGDVLKVAGIALTTAIDAASVQVYVFR
jgi:hypothetical protein